MQPGEARRCRRGAWGGAGEAAGYSGEGRCCAMPRAQQRSRGMLRSPLLSPCYAGSATNALACAQAEKRVDKAKCPRKLRPPPNPSTRASRL